MSKSDTVVKSSSAQLAALRLELIQEVQHMRLTQARQNKHTKAPPTQKAQTPDSLRSSGIEMDAVSVAFTLLNGWAQNNAGQVVYELVQQSLMRFAKKRPFQLFGISFAFGIAIVLVKPWRRLPKGLPATFGTLVAVKFYKHLMSVVFKKP